MTASNQQYLLLIHFSVISKNLTNNISFRESFNQNSVYVQSSNHPQQIINVKTRVRLFAGFFENQFEVKKSQFEILYINIRFNFDYVQYLQPKRTLVYVRFQQFCITLNEKNVNKKINTQSEVFNILRR